MLLVHTFFFIHVRVCFWVHVGDEGREGGGGGGGGGGISDGWVDTARGKGDEGGNDV